MSYFFYYKKFLFWGKKKVVGHDLKPEFDRMDLYMPDGGIYSIPSWSKYKMYLKQDWVLATKKQMEKESGKTVNLEVGNG